MIVLLDMLDNESVADLFWRDWQRAPASFLGTSPHRLMYNRLAFFYKQG